jgi:hypothetical protein
MQAHVIENGIVINTIEVDSLDVLPGLVEATLGGIGWKYDGTTFTAPDPEPEIVQKSEPTKEQLMAELAALTAKIQALE